MHWRSASAVHWWVVVLAAAWAGNAAAQPAGLTAPERPGEAQVRDGLLDLPPETAVAPEIVLPRLEDAPEPSRLSQTLRVFAHEIRVTGNTVFPTSELEKITAPYEGRELDSDGLEMLRHDLTMHYVMRSYINSGAVIPDQEIRDGIIEVQIIEGRLTEIRLTGNRRLRDRYIKKRLRIGNEGVLVLDALQERIQILHQDPLIQRINAQLQPGLAPGESVLEVDVEERLPYVLGAAFSNRRSASVGELYAQLYAGALNLTGNGDSLEFQYGLTSGLDDLAVSYAIPVTARDTRLRIYYDRSDSQVIEEPFDDIDIESETETYGAGISHPFYRTVERQLLGSVALERRRSETFLLGEPFSFSAGTEDGVSEVTALRLGQEWLNRQTDQVLALRSVFSVGIDAFDATNNSGDLPDGQFFAWLGQAQYARRLWKGQVLLRTDMQWSADPLLPLERFGIGGATSVRGYRENALVRDNAVFASIEFRYPIWRLPIPKLSESEEDGIIQIAPFVDFGWTDNVDQPTPSPRTLPSAGIGVRWDPHRKIHSELYWGYAFNDVLTGDDDSLQDNGIHFLLNAQLF